VPAVVVAPEVVAAVDKGGPEEEGVPWLRDDAASVGEEGDVEEVVGYREGGVDVDLVRSV
jgi:hypothetical protein